MKKRTRVTHLPDVEVPSDNRALVAPIYQSVKFIFDDVAETERYYQGRRAGFYYSRVSNPTLRQLENALAEMQGRDACLLTGSGMAAISATSRRRSRFRSSPTSPSSAAVRPRAWARAAGTA